MRQYDTTANVEMAAVRSTGSGPNDDDRTVAARKALLRHFAAAPAAVEIEAMVASSPVFAAVDERFRQIAARCFDAAGQETQSLAVSSATGGQGTSSMVLGIANAAARNLGSEVLILETDMAHPQLARDCGIADAPGLNEYLSSEIDLDDVVSSTRVSHVWMLPAGKASRNSGPLIRSEKFLRLLSALHGHYRTIIIDVPPLLTSPHAAVIANQADAMVLVVRAGATHVHDAAAALRASGDVPIRGVVLNGTRTWIPGWMARLLGVSRFAIE